MAGLYNLFQNIFNSITRLYELSDIVSFASEIGYDFEPVTDEIEPIENEITSIFTVIDSFETSLTTLEEIENNSDGESEAKQYLEIIQNLLLDFYKLYQAINRLGDSFDIANLRDYLSEIMDGGSPHDFTKEFFSRTLGWLIYNSLRDDYPGILVIFLVTGVITKHEVEEDEEEKHRIECVYYSIDFFALADLFKDPKTKLSNLYSWGQENHNLNPLFQIIEDFLLDSGIPASLHQIDDNLLSEFEKQVTGSFILGDDNPDCLEIIFWQNEQLGIKLNNVITVLPSTDAPQPPGIGIAFFAQVGDENEIPISENISVSLKMSQDMLATVLVIFTPDQTPIFHFIESDTDFTNASLALKWESDNQEPMLLLGNIDSSRLEIGSIGGVYGLELIKNSSPDLFFEIQLSDGKVVIDTKDGDSFIQKVLSNIKVDSQFDLLVGWSSERNLYFRGSGGLEITIPIYKSLGKVVIQSIYITIKLNEQGNFDLILAISAGAELGPVQTGVDRIGIKSIISFPEEGGNLGPLQYGVKFKPPTGAGLAIKTGTVTGGGYVEFDKENERYAGILELAFGEIGLTAIGLITTRMPDGSKDFSMLVIIGVEFDPPISLPYNFNLSGVGGLLGIKRSMNVDYLREGLKQGTLDSVLFPRDPILNASRIISDLRSGFPPTRDCYIVGPMAIIGWGNPLVIRAEIGIFIEVPSPVRIAILGQITAVLPNAEEDSETIVLIHLDILGILDFDKQSFSLDAVIYDSRILQFALSGDMAMRLYWGDPPYFLTSFGGYNPKFKARPGTPKLRRMMLSIGKGDNPRLSLKCYMALTSNTAQFGAKLELTAKKSGFKVHGYLYFHALFIFSPFSFIIDMGAGVDVFKGSRCLLSITLDLTLSGPTPWRAKGKAKFKILFVKVKVRFDKTFGKRKSKSLPASDPWPLLLEALNNRGNWKGILPGEKEQVIRLKKIDDEEDKVIVHSRGRLEISQNVVPFNLRLQKFGNAPIAGDNEYKVTGINSISVGDPNSLELTYKKDYVAKAQFVKMSDSEKLSGPSFEKEDTNILIGSDEINLDEDAIKECDLEYETEVIDENRVTKSLGTTQLAWQIGGVLINGKAKRERNIATKNFKQDELKPSVNIIEDQYRVVTKDGLNTVTDTAASYSQANLLMKDYIKDHPEQEGNVQIVSEYEALV